MNETKLNGVISTSLENIKEIVDVNTVIGEPINTAGGTVIIPVSKVSLGFVSGGVDYSGKKSTPDNKKDNFAGGGGTGVTMKPLGFLVVKADGNVEFISTEATVEKVGPMDSVIDLIEKSPDLIGKFKKLFAKDKSEKDDKSSKDDKSKKDETADEVVTSKCDNETKKK